jgi:hypothetical protein
MTMKRFISSALFVVPLAAIFAAPLLAAQKAVDFRRTLFVPAAQKMLSLEAPMHMCFLDKSDYMQGMMIQSYADAVRQNSGQVLLAVFMDCNDMANNKGWSDPDGLLPNVGLITWLNPAIGETTSMSRQDYLDMREVSFLQYAANSAGGLLIDKNVHRTTDNVSVGMSGTVGSQIPKVKMTGIVATTTLNHVPIEISLRYTGEKPPTLDKIYPLVDKFMAQQVALNK